jgi:hypothetical protein
VSHYFMPAPCTYDAPDLRTTTYTLQTPKPAHIPNTHRAESPTMKFKWRFPRRGKNITVSDPPSTGSNNYDDGHDDTANRPQPGSDNQDPSLLGLTVPPLALGNTTAAQSYIYGDHSGNYSSIHVVGDNNVISAPVGSGLTIPSGWFSTLDLESSIFEADDAL